MSTYNTTMFQSIKDALTKNEEKPGSVYNEILKTVPGNTYTVRLLPVPNDPKNTFFEYYNHGWVSFATGQYVQALSPLTFGERDPIAEERFRLLRVGSEADKEKAAAIKRIGKILVNVYVIDDPANPDNNGKVKILRYGKQLHKIITDAIKGDDAEEYGPRVFDLGPNGVNFKIKCEKQGDYPTYISSRFTSAGKLNLTDAQQQEIYNSAFDLTKVFPLKTYEELQQMLDDHFHVKGDSSDSAKPTESKPSAKPQHTESANDDFVDIDDLLKDLTTND